MIVGIGSDIIEISRIESAIERHGNHFLDRLYTPAEQAYCLKYKQPAKHFAGRFAVKEAIAKALGTGFGEHLGWLDLEVLNDETGKPLATLTKRAQPLLKGGTLHVTISHSEQNAVAFAVLDQ